MALRHMSAALLLRRGWWGRAAQHLRIATGAPIS
jgi:hypothetical protein